MWRNATETIGLALSPSFPMPPIPTQTELFLTCSGSLLVQISKILLFHHTLGKIPNTEGIRYYSRKETNPKKTKGSACWISIPNRVNWEKKQLYERCWHFTTCLPMFHMLSASFSKARHIREPVLQITIEGRAMCAHMYQTNMIK